MLKLALVLTIFKGMIMLKKIKNLFIATSLLSVISSCSQVYVTGSWENTVKDNDSLVKTTITLNQVSDSFKGTMVTDVQGATPNLPEIQAKKIDFSGYISGNAIVIEDVQNPPQLKGFKKTLLVLSDDGKTLTMPQSKLVFYKK